jgi:hypothetical protein
MFCKSIFANKPKDATRQISAHLPFIAFSKCFVNLLCESIMLGNNPAIT